MNPETIEDHAESEARFMARSKDSNRLRQTDKNMTDLNQAVREAMESFGGMRKDIAFRHRLRQNLPRVNFDGGELKQILLDLFVKLPR